MQIAEDILKSGATTSQGFNRAITDLIVNKYCKSIIETGSYLGTGTTKAIAAALTGDERVYSIECNPSHHRQAKANNADTPINFLLGLSVARADLPSSITFDVPDHIVVDYQPDVRASMYEAEVSFNVADNMLDHALKCMDYKPDLVILDSAGHMGKVEFLYLMHRVTKGHTFYLALDDTLHVKHYETMLMIKQLPDLFTIEMETDEKFGSAIIRVC